MSEIEWARRKAAELARLAARDAIVIVPIVASGPPLAAIGNR